MRTSVPGRVRSAAIACAAVLAAGCAGAAAQVAPPKAPAFQPVAGAGKVPVGAQGGAQWMSRAALPPGLVIGAGSPPLALALTIDGAAARATAAADLATAGVVASRTIAGAGTRLAISNNLDVPLKLDLYVSPDGERFRYASTCPVRARQTSFESWTQPIQLFAIGNPRVVTSVEWKCE